MTTVLDRPSPMLSPSPKGPRRLFPGVVRSDRIFHGAASSIGLLVLIMTGAIGIFLG